MKLTESLTLSKFINTGKLKAYYELTKPGITLTIWISMVAGFVLGAGGSIDYFLLLQASIGTILIAGGTAAHNQFMEWRLDSKMKRTKRRPLPSSKLTPMEGLIFSAVLMFGGLLYLIFAVNLIAGLAALATTTLYLFAYTPLKRVSSVNVLVGSVPGALPVVGGWAAATGHLGSFGMWLLFGIVFLWQIPHVMALALVCKDDYQQAGFHMLPANDSSGLKVSTYILLPLIILVPVVWGLYYTGLCNLVFLIGGLLSSIIFLIYGIKFVRRQTKSAAKKLMFASFFYLPVVWLFVFLDLIIR
jgi:protoheme IX farnesyltransferase